LTVVALRVRVGPEEFREVKASCVEYPTESPTTKAIKPTARILVDTNIGPLYDYYSYNDIIFAKLRMINIAMDYFRVGMAGKKNADFPNKQDIRT
jgi:hypothetical protein